MEKEFKEIENKFRNLRLKYRQKKISDREFKDRLKKLRLTDNSGKCWTIGARTGKWYCFDGKNWVESNPHSLNQKKMICIYCGFENDLEAEECEYCGGKFRNKENSYTDGVEMSGEYKSQSLGTAKEEHSCYLFSSINPISFLLFLGLTGLFFGVILGAFVGAADYFSGIASIFPFFLRELQGKLIATIMCGLCGGAYGFIILGIVGFVGALFFNLILSFFGGIKIRLNKI
ncbi:MAG: hypothetical protein U9Q97_05760 [Acidobacteriota bacterium]|nr:hypothetical protein [Acidobacteriota bacterium]